MYLLIIYMCYYIYVIKITDKAKEGNQKNERLHKRNRYTYRITIQLLQFRY